MINVSFIAIVPGFILAALTPAKVSDVETNSSAAPALKRPSVTYVRSFNISNTVAASGDATTSERPHLLARLRGGEENTVIGRHRQQQQEDTLAKVPDILQQALIEDLSKSVAPAQNGDGVRASRDCWVVTGEFVEVDTGNRALQAGVGFGAGQSQLEVRARVYAGADMDTPFLTFDSKGASGHLPGAVVTKNPYVAAAKFVMSKREPEREAKKVAKAIAGEVGKFMAAQGIPTLKSAASR
ncbi:MAG: hypothetical protein DME76_07140 [Verrucomicrobia bacterium]|nr:MAG: hypothetical protein DME76_07140 [Verrucomicrobiota bacterium]